MLDNKSIPTWFQKRIAHFVQDPECFPTQIFAPGVMIPSESNPGSNDDATVDMTVLATQLMKGEYSFD